MQHIFLNEQSAPIIDNPNGFLCFDFITMAREEALVEISGDITEADLKQLESFVLEQTGRKNIRLKKVVNKELLGGVKITCADKIWEYTTISAIGTLRPNSQKNI